MDKKEIQSTCFSRAAKLVCGSLSNLLQIWHRSVSQALVLYAVDSNKRIFSIKKKIAIHAIKFKNLCIPLKHYSKSQVFPTLRIKCMSANKLLGLYGQEFSIPPSGHPLHEVSVAYFS